METFYNVEGRAVVYVDDGESIYLFDGTPVAYIGEDAVFSYGGRFLGWFEDGWIRDRNGHGAFFTEDATGGPLKPMRKMKPMRSMKQLKPMRSMREMRPLHPIRSLDWSPLSHERFFSQ